MNHPFKIGHTSITWKQDNLEPAMQAIASLGYQGTETFSWIVNPLQQEKGTILSMIEKYRLPMASVFTMHSMLDPVQQEKDFDDLKVTLKCMHDINCRILVLSTRSQRKDSYSKEEMGRIIDYGNEIGRRCSDEGITCAFHPHTGTHIETREEIYRLMENSDPDHVFFAPDTGQIAKGGTDPVQVLKDFMPRIRMVHLKDYVGGNMEFDAEGNYVDRTGYEDYVILGRGVIDFRTTFDVLKESGYDGWIQVELDNLKETGPDKPEVAARLARDYLEQLLGTDSMR